MYSDGVQRRRVSRRTTDGDATAVPDAVERARPGTRVGGPFHGWSRLYDPAGLAYVADRSRGLNG
jgi:hypothetical protein